MRYTNEEEMYKKVSKVMRIELLFYDVIDCCKHFQFSFAQTAEENGNKI